MFRQDITYRIVVKDPELKALYEENLKKAKFGDRGFDLIVPEDYKIYIGSGSNKINHQVQVAGYYVFEDGTEHEVGYDLRVRSGTGANTRLRLANAPGTIDLYRGSIIALIDHIPFTNEQSYLEDKHVDVNLGKEYIVVSKGTRLVQLVNPNGYGVIVQFVDELPLTERGDSGFGSSGGI
jgi:dUTP pyrophosphatase